ncbi:cytochrome P450 monooxygenase, putative [Talaromyces stipitatus ATCC 10500]|uniref:Cytochrome P450 monooxygenase, putative n=1 Tax=Talaromyces stipitatus (strain ATCC 10500 / CBS 375.48 / QM 6759 / NRRL 1006) TaxID=441959 RepID=B8M1Q5_TALSN|nr:cytochrome P450 monooxygenase, putative [Talaromyces stipitatus ATCC 10500]EED22142.1 cytochrome P450 monooxygenase, putative [Talaromyces stipitatus ATCC 10500]
MLDQINLLDAKLAFLLAISMAILYPIAQAIYNVYFHPLSRFPGPISHAISRLPYFYCQINGTLVFDMLTLHQRYGDIVRIAPDELAFSHPDAWKDIMGHKNGEAEMSKASWYYRPIEEPPHIVNEEQERHRSLRRQMAHGFSEKSMRDQEPIIRKYVDLLVDKLRQQSNSLEGSPIVLSDWYNFTTFDIIGDLAFGEPFGCLQGSHYDNWIESIFDLAYIGSILQALSFYPWLKRGLLALVPRSARDAYEKHKKLTEAKMRRRMAVTEERPDLIEGLLKKKDELNLDIEHLVSNAEILIIGGSETTATLLSGVTYLILQDAKAYEKLKDEVRSTFHSREDINLISVNSLPYMLACLDEALRMYPPVANGPPRVCPKGGARILGEYIPENTYASIHHWAMYRREEYFTDPDTYHPERFLGDSRFSNDQREAFQPFHLGPRNCLGRNLAYSEIRLILALIIFNFDMTLADESHDWIQQRNYLTWKKPPLKVYLTPRNEEA